MDSNIILDKKLDGTGNCFTRWLARESVELYSLWIYPVFIAFIADRLFMVAGGPITRVYVLSRLKGEMGIHRARFRLLSSLVVREA